MNKVGFFKSIHFKLTMIYILLIVIAMQIIGVYFVGQLERSLTDSFNNSLNGRISLLSYSIEQEMVKERVEEEGPTLEEDINSLLMDFVTDEILEVGVINKDTKVVGTSNPYNREIIGKKQTDMMIERTLTLGQSSESVLIDRDTQNRVKVSYTPIKSNNKQETIGVIYLVVSMEEVFSQMKTINGILVAGTGIALAITALLGVILARSFTRPLSDMRKQAIELAKGSFSRKVKIYGNDEIGQLAKTFNYLTEELEEAQEITEGERKKLSSVIANMSDGVIATNRKGDIILINSPALKMLKVSRETALEMSIIDCLRIEDEYSFDDLLTIQEPLMLDEGTKEEPYILRVNFSVIQKENSRIEGLIAVIYDVTEQEKIDQERREFVANVSHELRTPLTTMRSYLEALADGAWRDEEIAPRFLTVTQDETERMIRLVNDLLQLSKMDSTDYRLNMVWVNFVAFFERIIDRFEISKKQHVTFNRQLLNEKIYVEIDTDKITQVLDNIISNALKYSPEGGEITFKVVVQKNNLQVSISDQGIGIPKDNVEQIFERFYRVDKARTRKLGGTGLGLAIAKEMVIAHCGEIWARSKEGSGTTIYFTLPISEKQEDDWDE